MSVPIYKLRMVYDSFYRTAVVAWAQANRTNPAYPNSALTLIGAIADQSVDIWSVRNQWESISYSTIRQDNVVAATTALRATFVPAADDGGRVALDAILTAMPNPPDSAT